MASFKGGEVEFEERNARSKRRNYGLYKNSVHYNSVTGYFSCRCEIIIQYMRNNAENFVLLKFADHTRKWKLKKTSGSSYIVVLLTLDFWH